MITFTRGNIFHSDAEAIVNTVNTVGASGKGLALTFKRLYPFNEVIYRKACESGKVRIGKMLMTTTDSCLNTKWIVNFPTKEHFRNPSKIEWIEEGLKDLRKVIINYEIKSIAIPALGAGLGGLDWEEVKSAIEDALIDLEGVNILVYEPL